MTKRNEYTQKFLKSFAPKITADLYWKLFIFSYFSHHTQHKSYAKIKHEMDMEFDRIKQGTPFHQCSLTMPLDELEASKKTFQSNDSKKIKRVLQFTSIEQLPKLIGISTFTNMIKDIYPSPFLMGLPFEYWNTDSINAMQKYFFNTTKHTFHLIQNFDAVTYFFSNPNFELFYFFNVIKQYPLANEDKFQRPDRRWDHTLFSFLLTGAPHNYFLGKRYQSIGTTEKWRIDFFKFFTDFFTSSFRNDDTSSSTIPVAIIHVPTENNCRIFNFENKVFPYPMFIFSSYDDLIEKLQVSHAPNDNLLQQRLKDIYTLRNYYTEAHKFHMERFSQRREIQEKIHDRIIHPHHTLIKK